MRFLKILGFAAVLAAVIATGASAFGIDTDQPPPSGIVGTPYKFVFQPKAGAPPYTFYYSAGDLPPGLKIETDGTMRGTPTQPGTFNFTVEATQYCAPDPSCASQWGFTVKIRDKLTITTPALKSATVGAPYTAPLTVTGDGGLGMAWTVSSGTLPAGVTLAPNGTPADGLISGTPTALGTSTFTVKLADTDGFVPDRSTTKQFTLAVVAPLAAQAGTASSPTGVVGKPYAGTAPAATGGAPPYTWTLTGGNAPPGLSIDPATGALVGTPTAAGTFAYTVGVADVDGRTSSTNLTVTVVRALDLVTTRIRSAKVDRRYRVKLVALGGVTPRSWKVTRGRLPANLRLNATTGVLTGTPRTAGTFRFTVTVSDSLREKSSQAFVLKVLG